MMVKPTVLELLQKAENRYSLVIATAKRARQISSGSETMTDKEDVSPVTLAADEIDEGKLKIYNQSQWNEILEENKETVKIENEAEKMNIENTDNSDK